MIQLATIKFGIHQKVSTNRLRRGEYSAVNKYT